MSSKYGWPVVVAVAVLTAAGNFTAAQFEARPLSRVGGATGQQLGEIYKSDIGTGFSSQSLNNIALQNARARTPYVGQTTTGPAAGAGPARISGPSGGYTAPKPFASFTPEPTTSPYLNLFREDRDGNSDLNYNTLVRPQLQQQQFNQQVQRQNLEIGRRLQSISAQGDFNPAGAKDEYPTGHPTAHMYYGHYYQHPAARRKQ